MLLQSARDLKRQVAFEVFAPMVSDLIAHTLNPSFDKFKLALPTAGLAIGIGIGLRPGEFSLALRLQISTPVLDDLVGRITALANGEVDVRSSVWCARLPVLRIRKRCARYAAHWQLAARSRTSPRPPARLA